MKKELLLGGLFLFYSLLIIGCRKVADSSTETLFPVQLEEKFFTGYRNSDATEKMLVDFIKGQNNKLSFLEKTIKQIGLPHWDKIMARPLRPALTSTTIGLIDRGDFQGSGMQYYIPFARESEEYVNAAMVINIDQSDTSFFYLCDWQYRSQNRTAGLNDKTKQLALLLMTLDKHVFGHETFRIKDTSLFKSDGHSPAYISLKKSESSDMEMQYALVEYCQDVTIYFVNCTFQGYPECTPTCDRCAQCLGSLSYQYCWEEWEDDGGGGGTGGGGNGGGGSGGGGAPPNPCDPGGGTPAEVAREMPCEGGGGGWEPDPIPVDEHEDPCSSTDQYSGATATIQYSTLAAHAGNFLPFNAAITDQPEQYFLVDNVNGVHVPRPIQTLPTGGGSLQGVTNSLVMMMHTHPYGGYPGPSADDLHTLSTFTSNFQISFIKAYDGTKYAMVVNNFSQLTSYVNTHPNFVGPGGQFGSNGELAMEWNVTVATLGDQGYTEEEAHVRATAYVMKKLGVTLVRAAPGSNDFKKIGLKQKMLNGNPVLNAHGDPEFENADCP